jgi:hypothetical protein
MLVAVQDLPDSRLLCIGSTDLGHPDLGRLRKSQRTVQDRLGPSSPNLPLGPPLQIAVGYHPHGCTGPKMTAAKSPESSSDGKPINMPGPDGSSCPGMAMMQASMSMCSLRGSPSCRAS